MDSKKIFNIIGIVLIPVVLVVALFSNQSNLFKGDVLDPTTPDGAICERFDTDGFAIQLALNNLNQAQSITTTSRYLNELITEIHDLPEFDSTDIQLVDPMALDPAFPDPTFPGRETTTRVADQLNLVQRTLGCPLKNAFQEYNPIVINAPDTLDQAEYDSIILDFFSGNFDFEELEAELGRELTDSEIAMLTLLGGGTDILGVKILPSIPVQLDDGAEFDIQLTRQSEDTTIDSIDISLLRYEELDDLISTENFYEIFAAADYEAMFFTSKVTPTFILNEVSNVYEGKIIWDGETCADYGISLDTGDIFTTNLTKCPVGKYMMRVQADLNHTASNDLTPRTIETNQIHFLEITSTEVITEDFPVTVNWSSPLITELFDEGTISETDSARVKTFTYNTTYNIDRTNLEEQEFQYTTNLDNFSYGLYLVELNEDGTENSRIEIQAIDSSTVSEITINWNELCGTEECNPELNYSLEFINGTETHRTVHSVPLAFIISEDAEYTAPTLEITSPEDYQLYPEGTTNVTLSASTGDMATVCQFHRTNPDFSFGDGKFMASTDPSSNEHISTLETESGTTSTITIKCAPLAAVAADEVTDELISTATVNFTIESDAATCTYLTENIATAKAALDEIFESNGTLAGDRTNTLFSDVAIDLIRISSAVDTDDLPGRITPDNYQDTLNAAIDFLNQSIPDDCDVENLESYDFTDETIPVVDINEPDEDETTDTSITLEVDTSIASECKASLEDLDFDDDDDDNLEMEENDDDDEFELDFDDLDEGETTIYVKCASKDDDTKIGEAEVTFTVEEDAPDSDLECEIDGDEDEFDPSTENIRFTYTIEGDSDVDEVDYTITLETDSGTEITRIKSDRNEELDDLEDLTKDWNGLVSGDRLVDGDYVAVLTAEDADDDRVTCTDTYEFELDDSLVDGIVLEINTLNKLFEPSISDSNLELINRIDGERVVLNAYETGNAAPIRTVFYQCNTGQKCPDKKGELKKGTHALRWNGSDSTGRFVVPGDYFYKASLKDEDDNIFVAFSDPVEAVGVLGSAPGGPNNPLFGSACNFADVPPSDLDFQAVQWVCQNGIFLGSESTINPAVTTPGAPPVRVMNINQPFIRGEFAAVANRFANCPQTTYNAAFDGNLGFNDLNKYINDPNTHWIMREIKNASRDCVSRGQTISGDVNGNARVEDQIIAAEMWKVIIEAAKNGGRANYNFTANQNQNPWYRDYQSLLQSNSVQLSSPDQGVTRRDAIRFIHNMYLRGLIR